MILESELEVTPMLWTSLVCADAASPPLCTNASVAARRPT